MNNQIGLNMTTTSLVTTVIVITLAIYDLVCVTLGNPNISVSAFLINAGCVQAPVIVFGLGYVMGHLTGYMQPVKSLEK